MEVVASKQDFPIYRRSRSNLCESLRLSRGFTYGNYTYVRIREILEGDGSDPEYAHLSPIDRKAILEILEDTKPDFKAWTRATAF